MLSCVCVSRGGAINLVEPQQETWQKILYFKLTILGFMTWGKHNHYAYACITTSFFSSGWKAYFLNI